MFRSAHDAEMYKMRVLNVLSDFTTQAITKTLHHYLGVVNVPEEDRGYIKMKNEFYYSRVIVTFAKK